MFNQTPPDVGMTFLTSDGEIEAARHLLGFYGHADGFRPGGFTTSFIHTLERADTFNRFRLIAAFPEFRKAYEVISWYGSDTLADVLRESLRTPDAPS